MMAKRDNPPEALTVRLHEPIVLIVGFRVHKSKEEYTILPPSARRYRLRQKMRCFAEGRQRTRLQREALSAPVKSYAFWNEPHRTPLRMERAGAFIARGAVQVLRKRAD